MASVKPEQRLPAYFQSIIAALTNVDFRQNLWGKPTRSKWKAKWQWHSV